uniref:BTB domain-containing protein n=1 Tax=Panagrellus redivivus TaxID=6233 RepID=A0A7E4ZR90_PANRE
MTTGTACLAKQIGDLYLNEDFSDITIVIEGFKLPAHRNILAQRCEYFKTMFKSGMLESTSKCIKISETPLNGFKIVLKWIYTSNISVSSIDGVLEVLRIAHMYQITELVDWTINYLKRKLSIEFVSLILSEAVLLSLDELINLSIEYATKHCRKVLKHKGFEKLSKEALVLLLTREVFTAPDIAIFHAVVGWMKANPSKSAYFFNIFNLLTLSSLSPQELASVPSDVVDANALAALAHQQRTTVPDYQTPDENVAVPKNGVEFTTDGYVVFVVNLQRNFLLNLIKMDLTETENGHSYSYTIETSTNEVKWTRVINHAKYKCRGHQNLHFEARPVRFIRIKSTRSCMQIWHFKALFSTDPLKFDPKTTLLIPSHNVALTEKNAIIIRGLSRPPNALIDGTFEDYSDFHGYTCHFAGNNIVVQLPQPYLIDSIKLLLLDDKMRVYSYNIEVSTDDVSWTQVELTALKVLSVAFI